MDSKPTLPTVPDDEIARVVDTIERACSAARNLVRAVEALRVEHSLIIDSISFYPDGRFSASRNLAAYVRDQCRTLILDLAAASAKLRGNTDTQVKPLLEHKAELDQNLDRVRRELNSLSIAIRGSRPLTSRIVAIIPKGLRRRLDIRYGILEMLHASEESILTELAISHRSISLASQAVALGASGELKPLEVRLVELTAFGRQLKEKLESAVDARAEARWRGHQAREAHHCPACGNRLAYDGVCIHCSR